MRDAESVNAQDALLCPTHKFLPFQIQRSHVADTYIQEAKMYDCDENETDDLIISLAQKHWVKRGQIVLCLDLARSIAQVLLFRQL